MDLEFLVLISHPIQTSNVKNTYVDHYRTQIISPATTISLLRNDVRYQYV
jgi:hypothetical protein